ncbi:MAG: phosphate ABC transporter permease PstA [Methanohalobium sp.]|uniref:phosphate ABC transporter permease PstA n=1 Tax=Methanohalobium sp. TaxID=2837493 RepID=UPI00397DE8E9
MKPKLNRRNIKDRMFKGVTFFSILAVLGVLFGIIIKIFLEGWWHLTPYFIFTSEAQHPGLGGAIGNAVVGTLMLAVFSTVLATPFAVGTAIYLKKYVKNERIKRYFSFFIDVLSGTPSIVLGIFGLLFFAYYLRFVTNGLSLISAVVALAILILPVIERATEEAIDTVPTELEDASYALGASKWNTIKGVTIPYATDGILTGIVLSAGRAAEESAVVILTAGYTQFMPKLDIVHSDELIFGSSFLPFHESVAALPITIYNAFRYPHMISPSEGFAASFVIIVIVILINAGARMIAAWHRK